MVQPYNIGLTVGADIDPLKRDLGRATKEVDSFGKSVSNGLSKAATAFAAFSVAGVAATGAIYAAGANLVDQQSKLARAIGGTVAATQALTYAADLAGVSMEGVEKDVRKLNASLANPSPKAFEALEKLGLGAANLLQMDVDGRIAAIADRFKELGYTTAEADAAMRNLGLRSADITKFMIDGGGAIRDARRELEQYGFALSDLDAAKVEEANDAFTRAQKVFSGVSQVVAVELAPYLQAVIVKFTEMAKEGGGVGNIVKNAMNSVIGVLSFVANAVEGVKRTFEVAGKAVVVAGLAMKSAMLSVADAITSGPIAKLNDLIDLANKLPNIDIENIRFTDTVRAEIDLTEAAIREGMADIHETLMQPLPGESFRQWAEEVQTSADQAAAAVVASRESMTAPEEIEDKSGILKTPMDEFELDGEDAFATEQELFAKHWDEMNRIAVAGAGGVAQAIASKWGMAAGSTAAAGKSMFDSFSQNSRKMFEVNKAWGIADAIVSTAQGIAAGVRLGWPMGIPAVAWAVANGAAQISKIRSTQFGGGGGSSPTTSAAGSSAQQLPNGGQQAGASGDARVLRIEGFNASSLYTGSQMENLANSLEEFWSDGGGKGRVIFADKER